MVTRNRVTPSPSVIDRDWPHQVALPDDLCTQGNLTKIMRFCQDHRSLRTALQEGYPCCGASF